MLALVPVSNAHSDCSNTSDDDLPEELCSLSSSPAPSIESCMENINISDSDPDNLRLTPIMQDVFPESRQELDIDQIPTLSELPSLPSVSETSVPVTPACTSKPPTPACASAPPATPATSVNLDAFISPITPKFLKRKTKSRPSYVAPPKRTRKLAKFTLVYHWQKAKFRHQGTFEEDSEYEDIVEVNSPLTYFLRFFSQDIIEDIVEQTNIYSVNRTGRSMNVTEAEIRDFLAIHIIMGLVRMTSYLDYWSQRLRYNLVADIMTLKRYQQIRKNIHFVDNNLGDTDRYCKVRPLIQKVRDNCLAHENEQTFSIDEMMIPYKGTKAGKRRQFMKDKPCKWGFKNYARAGVNGMIYDFVLYGGEDTFRYHTFTDKEASLGFGSQIVIALCKSIKKKPAKIFCDNFFTSPELLYILREDYGIFGTGTIRSNRLRGAEKVLTEEKVLKKKPRGSYAEVVCNKSRLAAVRWNDNKCVTLLSSCVGAEPVEKIRRYCKETKDKQDVHCPKIVKEYNKYMGGVDLADMLVSLYRIPFKSRKWYLGIFAQVIDICINNAWLLYRKDCMHKQTRAMALKSFRYEVSESLNKTGRSGQLKNINNQKKRNPAQAQPIDDIRYDRFGHFMDFTTQGRCRLCSKLTSVICIKCNARLCFVSGKNGRNCQLDYHFKK